MHCHRNTVLNRLHRVAALLGREDLDAVPPLELALALRAVGTTGSADALPLGTLHNPAGPDGGQRGHGAGE